MVFLHLFQILFPKIESFFNKTNKNIDKMHIYTDKIRFDLFYYVKILQKKQIKNCWVFYLLFKMLII